MTLPKLPNLATANEPVLIVTGVTAVLGWAAEFLVSRGILGSGTASTLTQAIAPSLILIVTGLVGLLMRKYVSPAWKVVQKDAAKVGIDLTGPNEVTALFAALGMDANGDPLPPAAPAPALAALLIPTEPPAPSLTPGP